MAVSADDIQSAAKGLGYVYQFLYFFSLSLK